MKTLSHHLLAYSGNCNKYQLALIVMAAYRGLMRDPETWNISILIAASNTALQKTIYTYSLTLIL